MKLLIKQKWEYLKASFWFIPVIVILTAIFAALLLSYIDLQVQWTGRAYWDLFLVGSADSARSVLGVISGAMIGVGGTVFSITLVALTLASSQFGSRLLQNFMFDKLNQVVLGSYVATFLYALIVIQLVKDLEDFSFIPQFSILFAIILALVNIVLLIVFIHHISVSIQSDAVVNDVEERLHSHLSALLQEGSTSVSLTDEPIQLGPIHTYRANRSGYIQTINYKSIFEKAKKKSSNFTCSQKTGRLCR